MNSGDNKFLVSVVTGAGVKVEISYDAIYIRNSVDNVGGEFSVTFADCGVNKTISVGEIVIVEYEGEAVTCGYCVRAETEYSKAGGIVTNAYCADMLGYLNNCQISKTQDFTDTNEIFIAQDLIYGLEKYAYPEVTSQELTSIKKFSVYSGESVGSAIGRLACTVSKVVYLCENQYLEFAKPGELINSTATTLEIGAHFVKKVQVIKSIEDSASAIYGRTHFDFETSTCKTFRYDIETFPSWLSMPNCITGTDSIEELKKLCEKRCCEVVSDMLSIRVELATIKNQKADVDIPFWHLNNKVILKDATQKLGFNGDFFIKSLEFRQDKTEGTTTTLTLGVKPEVTND